MKILKKGIIIDVNLDPTQGSETGKIRPCIIVTNDDKYQRQGIHVWKMPFFTDLFYVLKYFFIFP